jgi:serine/threonine protein kinase
MKGRPPADPPRVGTVLRERFELVEELGRGGMGVVFKALDRLKAEARDRQPYVALKVLNEEFRDHPDGFMALQREAKRANMLPHPNVIQVYDFDRDGEHVYLTMEYLTGRPLDDLMSTDFRGGISLSKAWPIIRAVGAALECGHTRGVIHCDLKPSNIFMCSDGRIKVLDFGIARRVPVAGHDTVITIFDPGKRIGALTTSFASLEMLLGAPADPRDDVYALGCLTYEMLAGSPPYLPPDARVALERGLTAQRLSALTGTQWRGLRQSLALRREERIGSVTALLNALEPGGLLSRLWRRS